MAEGGDQKDVESRYRLHDVAAASFASGSLVREQLHGEQRLTREKFLGQTQSYSAAPLAGDASYAGMQQGLRKHFVRWEQDGLLRQGTTCLVTCGILNG